MVVLTSALLTFSFIVWPLCQQTLYFAMVWKFYSIESEGSSRRKKDESEPLENKFLSTETSETKSSLMSKVSTIIRASREDLI